VLVGALSHLLDLVAVVHDASIGLARAQHIGQRLRERLISPLASERPMSVNHQERCRPVHRRSVGDCSESADDEGDDEDDDEADDEDEAARLAQRPPAIVGRAIPGVVPVAVGLESCIRP
jgi:hypothetical protein